MCGKRVWKSGLGQDSMIRRMRLSHVSISFEFQKQYFSVFHSLVPICISVQLRPGQTIMCRAEYATSHSESLTSS